MSQAASPIARLPLFPAPLAIPLGLIPTTAHSALLVRALNRVLAPEIAEGELDFLDGKVMRIEVTDARLKFRISLHQKRLVAAHSRQPDDLSIAGTVYDFLLLATRREDPDTLFFNRRLHLGGDTELGLYVKNLLDSLELEERIGPLLKLLNGTTSIVERLAGGRQA